MGVMLVRVVSMHMRVAIPSFSRLAIVRWLIDPEADMHFRLRPHVTRSAPCRVWLRRPFLYLSGWFLCRLCSCGLGPPPSTGSLIPLITLLFRPLPTLLGFLVTVLRTRRLPSSLPPSELGPLFLLALT